MKFKIDKKKLIKKLKIVMKGIDFNPVLPSLKGLYIKVTKTNIIFTTSDGNLSIKTIINVDEKNNVLKTGEVLVPCKLFFNTIIKQIGETISIEKKNNLLFINSINSSITINLLDITNYPIINFDLNGKEFKINEIELKAILREVNFAAAENNDKIILNGINFSISNKILVTSATNSYRLATKKILINSNDEINFTIFAKNLKKFIDNDEKNENKELTFVIDDEKINLKSENTIIQSKLLEGEYPNITDFIPNKFDYELLIDSQYLIQMIERATAIDVSQNTSIKLEVIPSENKMTIKSKKEEVGSIEIEEKNINWRGEQLSISFDSKFMIDALKPFKGQVEVLFGGELKPIIIRSDSIPELTEFVLPQKTY